VVCVYDFLKSTPSLFNVAVYSTPQVAYEFKGDDGRPTSAYFLVSSSRLSGRDQIVGDYLSFGNPVSPLIGTLRAKCRVDVGYLDQVITTNESQRVNMDRN